MKSLLPSLLLTAALAASASAATVFTNLGGPVSISTLIKGTGGFIPSASEYGFEFSTGGGDHELLTITLSIGTHFGTLPLTVELYSSPSVPDAATFLTALTGPSQPANQQAVYSPVLPTTLSDGATYFVRLWVNGSASSYAVQETTTPGSGTFTLGNNFLRTAGSSWGPGEHVNEPLVAIEATPIPEPATAMLGCAGFMLILRRRRW